MTRIYGYVITSVAFCGLCTLPARAQESIDSAEELVTKLQLLNHEEIEVGKLAMEMASSPRVREYGRHLTTDHQKSQERLKRFAMTKQVGWIEPMELTPDRREAMEKLAALRGEAFDSSFLREMEAGHQAAVIMITGALDSLTDTEAQKFASETLPMLKDHLERAKRLQKKPTE